MTKPLLYHAELMWLLEEHRARQAKAVAGLLAQNRKGSNANYQAVVDGKRPRRADKVNQEAAQLLSRVDMKDYWLGRLQQTR